MAAEDAQSNILYQTTLRSLRLSIVLFYSLCRASFVCERSVELNCSRDKTAKDAMAAEDAQSNILYQTTLRALRLSIVLFYSLCRAAFVCEGSVDLILIMEYNRKGRNGRGGCAE